MTPPDDMVTWLRGALDEMERTAREAPGLLSGVVLARVEAERGLLNLYAMHDKSGEHCDQDEGRRWLAYSHRYDAPGWRQEWTPDSVQAPT